MTSQAAPLFDWAPDHLLQNINPWKLLFRPSGQFGFVNVYNMASSDTAKEEKIISEVAGYGRQLGRLTDVVGILLGTIELDALTPTQRDAVREFREMARQIAAVRGEPTVDTIATAIDKLKSTDRDAYEQLLEQLRVRGPATTTG